LPTSWATGTLIKDWVDGGFNVAEGELCAAKIAV